MARQKMEEWDIAEKLGVTLVKEEEDKKITDVEQVLSALEDVPEGFRAILPKMRAFANFEDFFVLKIKLAENRVEREKERLEDFRSMKDPKKMALRKLQKYQKQAAALMEQLKKMGVDPASLPQ